MSFRNLATVLGIALITMVGVRLMTATGQLNAENDQVTVSPKIVNPTLTVGESDVTLKLDQETYASGESPGLSLTASNPTDKPIEDSVWISLTAESPTSPLSRVVAIPETLWHHEAKIVLKPGETRSYVIATDTALPDGKSVSIILSPDPNPLVVTSLSRGITSRGLENSNQQQAEATQFVESVRANTANVQ